MNYSSFFGRDTSKVAQELLGRLIIYRTASGIYAAEIRETGAYEGGEMTEARKGMFYDAGKIFLMPFRSSRLLNIASGHRIPACVEIQAIADRKNIEGSGAITNYLEIPDELDGKFLGNESGLFISDESYRSDKIKSLKPEGRAPNCIGIFCFA